MRLKDYGHNMLMPGPVLLGFWALFIMSALYSGGLVSWWVTLLVPFLLASLVAVIH